jgi:hypothetical protein
MHASHGRLSAPIVTLPIPRKFPNMRVLAHFRVFQSLWQPLAPFATLPPTFVPPGRGAGWQVGMPAPRCYQLAETS